MTRSFRIVATADLHGHLPDLPDGDLLVLAGDVLRHNRGDTPKSQAVWMQEHLVPWLDRHGATAAWRDGYVVLVPGNHDNCLGTETPPAMRIGHEFERFLHRWNLNMLVRGPVLFDNGLWVQGFAPTPAFEGQNPAAAANSLNDADMRAAVDRISDGLDLLITHGPPAGFGDGGFGCPELRDRLSSLDSPPRLHLFGHIHSAGGTSGEYPWGGRWANVAHVGEDYRPRVAPMTFDLEVRS